ncbi:hypothetical protein [Photobacterium sanguinicancri]|uniref:hypothetical protein n=1 Tax=Photobacterium sanguinicancri TaxID=875932 RepID=UPI0026E16962|nr:hypothetical protein [Photobacterium sanguinicancri]MDO6498327.1 hypothetical protein [Photobacterium sanguinicancri]
MKNIILLCGFLASFSSFALDFEKYCGDLGQISTWVQGDDVHNVWIDFNNNPKNCEGGFYLPHIGNNRDFVYSTILAAKFAKHKICFQTYLTEHNISNRCKINYVYLM